MKKVLLLLTMLLLTVGLVACGDSETSKSKDDSSSAEKENSSEKSQDENSKENDEDVQESDVGKMTITYKNKDMDENAESGPIKFNVNGLQMGDFEIAEAYRDAFDGKEKATIITFKVKTENTSDDTIGFYPDQATITTDAGDQVDADMVLSDSVGGDFIGKVKKEGQIFFLVDTPSEKIKEINLIIAGPHTEDFDKAGDDVKMTFSVE